MLKSDREEYMTVEVSTIVYPTSVLFTFKGSWSWQELRDATDRAKGLFNNLPPKTPVIFDLTDCHDVPNGGLVRIPEIMKQAHKHVGYAVFIADQTSHTAQLLREMINMVERVYGISWDVRYVNHYPAAIEHIQITQAV